MAKSRFCFVSLKDMEETRENRVPVNTKRHTLWSSNAYKQWAEERNREFEDFNPENIKFPSVPMLKDITVKEIDYWFSRFVLEVKKKDGNDYQHEVLNSLFCGLSRVIKEVHPAISILHSTELKQFQQTLDGRLKELQASQQPFKKQADAITVNDENEMWSKGVLGTHSPHVVINTLMFLSRKLFALRGGKELRELSHKQIEFDETPDGSMLVTFKEKVSKTNQGGLKRRKIEAKLVQHYEDPSDEKSFTYNYFFYINKW
ncbi:hypothetical protein QZH41_002934 [Actinostola sp. cb2023]|nr:hypothetical protein QZH41_002934 [Actinostola sp. cb2023]